MWLQIQNWSNKKIAFRKYLCRTLISLQRNYLRTQTCVIQSEHTECSVFKHFQWAASSRGSFQYPRCYIESLRPFYINSSLSWVCCRLDMQADIPTIWNVSSLWHLKTNWDTEVRNMLWLNQIQKNWKYHFILKTSNPRLGDILP